MYHYRVRINWVNTPVGDVMVAKLVIDHFLTEADGTKKWLNRISYSLTEKVYQELISAIDFPLAIRIFCEAYMIL